MPAPGIVPVSLRDPAAAFADRLWDSFARYGFAVVADHGLDERLVTRAYAAAKAFFALPETEKLKWRMPGGGGQRGYTPFGVEAAKGAAEVDLKEFWHVGRELAPGHRFRPMMPDNVWPDVQDFRAALYGLYEALDGLGLQVLGALATRLELPQGYFDAAVGEGNSILRLLHYPPTPPNPSGVRAGAHEDINAITLLLGAEEAGLQLLDRDGRWLEIAPPPGCVVVNIGDMLQRLTNHVLPSTTHRVVNPTADRAHLPRYSIPFFQHFTPDFLIETLPSCMDAQRPNRYPQPITAHDYLLERLREIRLT
jgi:isopenicillin N synthase-like dioxygenase